MRSEDALGDAACLKQHETQKNRIAYGSPYRSNRIAACGDALDEHRIDRNTDQYEHPLKAHGEQGFYTGRQTIVIMKSGNYRVVLLYGSLSPFMRVAVLAAYTDAGKAWIDELMDLVHENESLVRDCFARCMPAVRLLRHRAGTLVWADFRGLGLLEPELEQFFLSAGVEPDLGSKYGAAGTGFLRLQIGMPRAELTGALTRLEAAARKCGFAQEASHF